MKTFHKYQEKPIILKGKFDFDYKPFSFGIDFDPVLEFHIEDNGFNIVRKNSQNFYLWSDIVQVCLIARVYTSYGVILKWEGLRLKLKNRKISFSLGGSSLIRKWSYFQEDGFIEELKKHIKITVDSKDYTGLHIKLMFVYLLIGIVFLLIYSWRLNF